MPRTSGVVMREEMVIFSDFCSFEAVGHWRWHCHAMQCINLSRSRLFAMMTIDCTHEEESNLHQMTLETTDQTEIQLDGCYFKAHQSLQAQQVSVRVGIVLAILSQAHEEQRNFTSMFQTS